MSWSGTVTCSYCYKTGHNRRKCPDLTERIALQYTGHINNAKQSRADGKISDAEWYDSRAELKRQEYLKRTKIDLATGEKVTNKAAKAARKRARAYLPLCVFGSACTATKRVGTAAHPRRSSTNVHSRRSSASCSSRRFCSAASCCRCRCSSISHVRWILC